MSRPKLRRFTQFHPQVVYFKPQGIPMRFLDEVVLLPEELEAIKLHDIDGLDQIVAAACMGISQPSFARDLETAHQKIASAIILGKAIRIEIY